MRHIFYFLLSTLFFSFYATAQENNNKPVQVTATYAYVTDTTVLLSIQLKPNKGITLYSVIAKAEEDVHSTLSFDAVTLPKLIGNLKEEGTVAKLYDSTLQQNVTTITDSAVWQQLIKVMPTDSFWVKATIAFFYKQNNNYLTADDEVRVFIKPFTVTSSNANKEIEQQSLWFIFLAAFGGGLLALLTPCVYSMIPVTVSFFTKRSKTPAEGKRNAILYASSIITIFTVLGFAITLIFGPAALNNLATNWIANLLFFVLFLVFGISFLGAFEITLPSKWSNAADTKANTKSFWGIFFMALTLVLVSFSCTGPIIGNLLVLAAKGSYWGPLTGMFGFSVALALPFALFAFFPGKLNVLGKAGGWLNAIKVTLGFLELALALKFLSNADLVKGWRLLDREIFIALWVVIFGLLGLYLLGKLKLHHDDELPKNDFGLPYLTVTRLFFAIASLSFALYLLPGMWGAPLKGVSAFVPPMGTQDFVITANHANNGNQHTSANSNALPAPEKYASTMKIYEPEVVVKYGMVTYFDYDEALAVARKLKKPLMIDFTGINCVNCRKMEGEVWSNPEVMKRLKEDFVIVSLYVDVQNIDLPENEVYYSKELNKQVTTLGDKNADMQVKVFGANSQPYYFFLDNNEKRLINQGYGYNPNVQSFINHLDKALEEFKKR
jgi:thiol:disulfide interchange protein DsbD